MYMKFNVVMRGASASGTLLGKPLTLTLTLTLSLTLTLAW